MRCALRYFLVLLIALLCALPFCIWELLDVAQRDLFFLILPGLLALVCLALLALVLQDWRD